MVTVTINTDIPADYRFGAVTDDLKLRSSMMLFAEAAETDDKHSKDAKSGWYRCTVRFTLPTCDDKGNVIGKNAFQGRMIIRFDEDGKKYLYDIIDIKKET